MNFTLIRSPRDLLAMGGGGGGENSMYICSWFYNHVSISDYISSLSL
jgi:hypothetical protein